MPDAQNQPSQVEEQPQAISFEAAIALTQQVLTQYEAQDLSETEFIATIQQLVTTANGARGFFVTALTSDAEEIDQWLSAIAQGLSQSPQVVTGLLVKNLAMSTAMAITHRRNHHDKLASSSDRVQARTQRLFGLLPWPELQQESAALLESLDHHTGEYQTFLQRWGYDHEQQAAIRAAIVTVMATGTATAIAPQTSDSEN